MVSSKVMIFGFIALSLTGMIIYSHIVPEKAVYQESFEDCNLEGDFLECKDGVLYLDTGNPV